jgi:hypothetical protein
VVSAAFREFGADPRVLNWFSSIRDTRLVAERAFQIGQVLDQFPTISHERVQLPYDADLIRQAIIARRGPISEVVADEWAFLQTQSWFVARLRRTADRFVQAGASLVDHPRQMLEHLLIEHVIPREHIPTSLTPAFLAIVGAKWAGVGGAAVAAHAFGPLVAMGAEIAATKIVRMFDP